MAKYVLPDISGVWDKARYPYALIQFVINKETSPTSKYVWLYTVDLPGYVERTESHNAYWPHENMLYLIHYAEYLIALNDAAVEDLNKYWSGVNKETWCLCSEDHGYAIGMGDGPHWANTTLYDEDGNLFLEASDPGAPIIFEEPIDPLKSFLIGYALGLSGKPLPLSGGEPVAYLYNGVRLPKLPEWDKEAYPYAGIFSMSVGFMFRALSPTAYYFQNGDEWTLGSFDGNLSSTKYNDKDNWGRLSHDTSYGGLPAPVLIWTNFDFMNEDGSVYLAASEPIPVYD